MLNTALQKSTQSSFTTSNKPSFPLCEHHQQEWVKKRKLSREWIAFNCTSVSAEEATEYLGYPAKSGGVLLQGANYSTQFKPDKPWSGKQGKKAPKYRTPSGVPYDAFLPNHPTEPDYWTDFDKLKERCYKINGVPCIVITEGVAKAIAGCSNGLPTISLMGVDMGLTPRKDDPQGRRYVVPGLACFAKAGFGIIFAFDADCADNPDVLRAEKSLTYGLKQFSVPVFSVTGLWTAGEGKGMDDYITQNGIEAFREKLSKAFERNWDAETNQEKPVKPPQATVSASILAENYQNRLAWHDKEQVWYRYEAFFPGVWSDESEIAVEAVILAELEAALGLTFGSAYLSDVTRLLKRKLIKKHWDKRSDLIPLIDGVLRKDTLELLPHSPGYFLTWSIPIRWADRAIGFKPIEDWMLEIQHGNHQLVQVLRAILNCVVHGRADFQRYLEAIGPGGTGKGTFFRLATALVGEKNVFTSTLKNLEENRFELAAAEKAKLILITEAEKHGGEVNVLKALTGEDINRVEVKGRQQKCGDGFTFSGFVLVSANEPPQSSDYTSGLQRRRLSLPFNHVTAPSKRRNLNKEFEPYLAGLLEWVLTMPESEARSLVVDTKNSVPALEKVYGEALCDANPMADWLDNNVIYDQSAKTYIGVDNYEKAEQWLYANYASYIRSINGKPIGTRRYSKLLEDLCCNQLKLANVKRLRDRNGAYFDGLRLRMHVDLDPRPVTGELERFDGSVTAKVVDCDGSVTAGTLGSDGCDGCDGFFEVDEKNKNKNKKPEPEPKPPEPEQTFLSETLAGNANFEGFSITEPETPAVTETHPSHSSITTHHNPSHPSQKPITEENDPWLSEAQLADVKRRLEECEDKAELASLRDWWKERTYVLKIAARNLTTEKRNQLKQWILELDEELKPGAKVKYVSSNKELKKRCKGKILTVVFVDYNSMGRAFEDEITCDVPGEGQIKVQRSSLGKTE